MVWNPLARANTPSNVLSHTLLALDRLSWASEWLKVRTREIAFSEEDCLSLAYGALFHDLGKQDTSFKNEAGRVHFYDHEAHSCRSAEGIMERFRFSNSMRTKVLHLIKNHMRILNFSEETKDAALRRLVNQMGNLTPLLVIFTLADKEASRGILSVPRDAVVESHCLRVMDLFQQEEIVHPPPLITGHDVMALAIPPDRELDTSLT